jgi:hypothetical protein
MMTTTPTFRGRRIWADALVLTLLLPIALAVLTFLTAFVLVPVTSWLGWRPDDRTLLLACAAIAVPVLIAIVRLHFFWSIALEHTGVRLGTIWPRRIAYDRVRFIKAGRDADPVAAVRRERGVIPFSFAVGWLREYRLFLEYEDARECLRELHARSPNASAIDVNDRVLPPRNAGPTMSYSELRVVRSLGLRAVSACIVALIAIAVLFVPAKSDSLQDIRDSLQRSRALVLLLPLVPALFAYAIRNAVRIRRIVASGWAKV